MADGQSFNYIAEANVTASNQFHGEMIAPAHLSIVLAKAIEALRELDYIKKALFYGREVPQESRSYLAPSVHGVSDELPNFIDHRNRERGELILHSIIGGATEVGELLELLENVLFGGEIFDAVNFGEELGDAFWYQAIGANAVGLTFDQIQRTNIAKLRHRFPNKFTEFDANNRDLSGERKILTEGA